MCDVYRVSSSVKVEQMEAELSQQLSALRVEIEESGFPQRAASSICYSSVPLPKDISIFRVEREHVLRRGLKVAEALPVQSPAEVMQRELDSCLSLEYTADSLPPLLHQFYTDRSYHLAQIKYLLMLRWRRFCRHASAIESLYPHYKDQVSYLTSEYEDAIQRARRLSVSREKILTGRGNPANLLSQDDIIIYLRWLVCHLHSVQTVRSFLSVLHYMPACERKDKEPQSKVNEETLQHADGISGLVNNVPLHTVHLEEFLPELQALITHFNLSYDARKLQTTADEMELFSMVWREFRSVFRQQEQMKTFPQYDGSEVRQSQWGRQSMSMALKKEADWIPFIQVKPRLDPWQQKLVTKLKGKKSVDELLKMQSSFLQVPDLLHVAVALKEHAAHVGDLKSAPTSSVPHGNKTKRNKISKIWASIYSAASVTQETREQARTSEGRGRHDEKGLKSQTSNATNECLQLLGLDSLEDGTSDPIVTRGAYLCLIYLRHLKLRQLQRVSLGLLNYLRSVERTLTFDLAGLQLEEGVLHGTADETGWMNAARGGRGEAGGLDSQQYSYNTPVDYKVQCSEFMEFAEVENLHDFYSAEGHFVHTQDQRGFYIVYDAALKDLKEVENELLLVGSHFIQRNRIKIMGNTERDASSTADVHSWAGEDVDRVAVLLDLWTCETEFLESKVQLLNCYYEAYQHAAGTEERFALARVITDIVHSRPPLDLDQDYFVQAYRSEIRCLRSHQQLITDILNNQIEKQRQYLQHIWRDNRRASVHDYGLPPNYAPKHLVSLGGCSPALMNVFLLEVHPSLCLASAVYHGLAQAHTELCQLHRATGITDKLILRQRLLQQALQSWNKQASHGASYSSQIQKDLFSGAFVEDPFLVQNVGLSLVRSAEERGVTQGRETQLYAVETFSRLLELITIRHRLLESASETAHLAQLYRDVASELGFDDVHLYLRPVQFEAAEQKDKSEQRPVFMTAVLEDDSSLDRFTPSHLPLSIQELDENQIGRFSFSSEEAVIHLMNKQSVENLQVTVACQVSQKNALISAVKLVCLCHWAETVTSSAETEAALCSDKDIKFDSKHGGDAKKPQEKPDSSPSRGSARTPTTTKKRLMEAFVSIQLEKASLRDEMLNSFMKKKQAVGGLIKTPEEAAAIKRILIVDFLKKFSTQISQHCVRAQLVAYYYSLTFLLDNIPFIRQSYFMIGRAGEPKVVLDSGADLCPDPRTSESRPLQQLLSEDGKTLLNLWFIPHFSQVLHMFKTLNASACAAALHHTLHIVTALHDIIYYLVSFSRLGNTEGGGQDPSGSLAADWGGTEGIGAELLEIQRQVDRLSDRSSPESVGRLLKLRRQVLLLQFDTAVRHLIREVFLSCGDVASYQSVSDNMAAALPLLGDSIQTDVFSLMLPVPRPLETPGCRAQKMYPMRSFTACQGSFPLRVWDVPLIEYCMQLCLSGLSDRSRLQANAAILGVSLLMEDVLNSGGKAEPVRLHGNKDDFLHDGKPNEEELEAEAEKTRASASAAPQDPIRVQSVLKGFLLLTKQLQVFKESWSRRRLDVQMFRTPSVYQQFVTLYRAEIFYPSMRALAQQMGKEQDYEVLISGSQSLLPPPGASEVEVKAWQLHKLLESTELDMIRAVQRRINREMTLVVSERTRQDAGLPTELWKKAPLRHSLSPERPQIVETFIQQLMEGAEETEGQLRVPQDHFQRCLTHLGGSLMERERRSFLLYSQFYEQILQQETQLLYQREQDLKNVKDCQTSNSNKEVAAVCRGMMLEVSALQAKIAHLEQEKTTREQELGLKFKERYDPLVRHLVSTCIQLKARLDESQWQMEQEVSEVVHRIRGEGVERIIQLKKKYGCTRDNDGLTLTQLKKEEVHELHLENSRLTALLCKLKALSIWRQLVNQERLHRQLLQTQQREIACRSEALRVKMTSEEDVVLLQEELEAMRKALTCCQAECSSTKKLLSRKTEELQLSRHQSAQEARSRQELDSYRVQNLEQMRADVEERERKLRALSEQLDRGSRMSQLQRQRSAKEIRQVRVQLQQELSLKQEAFQQVDRLQSQVNNMEAALSRCTSSTGPSRAYYMLSVSKLSARSPSAGLHRAGQQKQQQSALQLGSLTNYATLQDFATEPRHQRAETGARSRSNTRTDRPKAEPTRVRVLTADTTLPDL